MEFFVGIGGISRLGWDSDEVKGVKGVLPPFFA